MLSISCYTWILFLEIKCRFASKFCIDLILEVTVDLVKVARNLYKLINLPTLLFNHHIFVSNLSSNWNSLWFESIKFESLSLLWNLFLYRRARKWICKFMLKCFIYCVVWVVDVDLGFRSIRLINAIDRISKTFEQSKLTQYYFQIWKMK